MNEVEVLIEKLSKAVSFQYPGKCAPSVVVSWLPNKSWYVSIVSYEDGHDDKKVLYKARNTSLASALKDVSKQLLDNIVRARDPLDELNLLLLANEETSVNNTKKSWPDVCPF